MIKTNLAKRADCKGNKKSYIEQHHLITLYIILTSLMTSWTIRNKLFTLKIKRRFQINEQKEKHTHTHHNSNLIEHQWKEQRTKHNISSSYFVSRICKTTAKYKNWKKNEVNENINKKKKKKKEEKKTTEEQQKKNYCDNDVYFTVWINWNVIWAVFHKRWLCIQLHIFLY